LKEKTAELLSGKWPSASAGPAKFHEISIRHFFRARRANKEAHEVRKPGSSTGAEFIASRERARIWRQWSLARLTELIERIACQ
jgi:hypothetical protein